MWRTLALALIAWTSVAGAQGGRPVTLMAQGAVDGPMYEWEIERRRFDSQPTWTPSAGFPPLAIGDAVATAQKWISARHTDVSRFALSNITLAPIGSGSEQSNRWYYRIEFNPVVGGQRLYGGQFIAVVLFDGSIVEPRVEKRTNAR